MIVICVYLFIGVCVNDQHISDVLFRIQLLIGRLSFSILFNRSFSPRKNVFDDLKYVYCVKKNFSTPKKPVAFAVETMYIKCRAKGNFKISPTIEMSV